jgi:hypothetical protein
MEVAGAAQEAVKNLEMTRTIIRLARVAHLPAEWLRLFKRREVPPLSSSIQ